MEDDVVTALCDHAVSLGAGAAGLIAADAVPLADHLAGLCKEPHECENYALSPGCPPHIGGPPAFRRLLQGYRRALAVKLEVPTAVLMSEVERVEVFALLHEVVAGVELKAVALGLQSARAFAGGACKSIFCSTKASCRVLERRDADHDVVDDTSGPTEREGCRHPDKARPSMSGFGIDVTALMTAAGWTMNREPAADDTDGDDSTMTLAGLILLD